MMRRADEEMHEQQRDSVCTAVLLLCLHLGNAYTVLMLFVHIFIYILEEDSTFEQHDILGEGQIGGSG